MIEKGDLVEEYTILHSLRMEVSGSSWQPFLRDGLPLLIYVSLGGTLEHPLDLDTAIKDALNTKADLFQKGYRDSSGYEIRDVTLR